MKIIQIIAVIFLLGAGPVHAQRSQGDDLYLFKGKQAYVKGNYERAVSFWEKSAQRGNPMAMYGMARIYQLGFLGKPDLVKAEKWLREAAIWDVPPAKYYLGKLLTDRGEYQEAARWIAEAAGEKYSYAEHDLAVMYEEGKGVEQSIDRAVTWYLSAAKHGSVPAIFKLVYMYINGHGVEKDEEKAFYWAEKASKTDDPNGRYLMGYMYYVGIGTKKDMKQATIWLQKAVEEGQPKAQILLDKIQGKDN